MSGNEKNMLAPRLRFPEFQDSEEWKAKSLDSVCNVLQGYGFPESLQGRTEGRYPFCKVSDISRAVAENGGLLAKAANYVGDSDLLELRAKLIPIGTTVFAKIGEALRLNRRAFVQHECLIDNNAVGLKGVEGISDDYFIHLLSQLIDLNEHCGGAVPSVNKSTLEAIKVIVPELDEQQKIADCLSSLDELITTETQKLDALKTHKKGLMQQLFPREGETVPRLRFPEFRETGAWEAGQLIALSNEPLSNGVFNDPKRVGAGYKLINVSDMYIDTAIDEKCLSLLELSQSDFEANQVKHGDIFFTRSSLVKSGIAVSNIYLGNSSDVTFDGHLIRFRANTNKVVPLFAHYLFKTPPIRAQLIARGKSATMTTIGQADVASVTLSYPPKEEQQAIADCLSSLDDLVTAQSQRIDALKTHKKGLMQQLFPVLDEAPA